MRPAWSQVSGKCKNSKGDIYLILMMQHLILVGRRYGGYQVDAEQMNPIRELLRMDMVKVITCPSTRNNILSYRVII